MSWTQRGPDLYTEDQLNLYAARKSGVWALYDAATNRQLLVMPAGLPPPLAYSPAPGTLGTLRGFASADNRTALASNQVRFANLVSFGAQGSWSDDGSLGSRFVTQIESYVWVRAKGRLNISGNNTGSLHIAVNGAAVGSSFAVHTVPSGAGTFGATLQPFYAAQLPASSEIALWSQSEAAGVVAGDQVAWSLEILQFV